MKHCQAAPDLLTTNRSTSRFGGRRVFAICSAAFGLAWGLRLRSSRVSQCLVLMALLGFAPVIVLGKVTGSISGTVRDSSGAVMPGVKVEAVNIQTGVAQMTQSDSAGFYNFPALAIGHYNISFRKGGFQGYQEKDLMIDVDTALRVDPVLQVGATKQEVTVTGAAVHVDTQTTQMGEVIGGTEMASLPLNGRSYTDLLALQPGVVPFDVAMFGHLTPSNFLNAGVLSMSGQRDVQNGYMVNGANTVEGNAGGALIIPNLDSIAEFRIITSNAGAEYGNYSGGQINVATKSGTNEFHGSAFEFLRNSDLDARNFYSPSRGVFHQNMFGGTFGGPLRPNKAFFFGDYQGTRQVIGVDTGNILVPSSAERQGNFSDRANLLKGTVVGPYWANTLSTRLGYAVTVGEPYYAPGCTSSANCVFPNAIIPTSAWSSVSPNVIPLIPVPNSGPYFTTSANSESLRDNKWAIRIDGNTRLGMISGYYHHDPWVNTNPYNPSYGGSTVPGFPNQTLGKAQLLTLGITTPISTTFVSQFTASYTRNKNVQGLSAKTGPSLSSMGFAAPDQGGIYQLSTQYQNWPELSFNNFTLGAFNSIIQQYDEVYQLQNDFTKVIETHTLKFGGNYHWDHVNISHPNNGSNGGFGFNGQETGIDFADMLIGAPNYFFQGAPAALALRSYYVGVYGEDSWRVTRNLTFNYGLRWETTPYWSDAKNRNPDLIRGLQSKIFPTAPVGYVFPGDPGVPAHFANTRWNDFGPRLGLAYSPNFSNGILHKLFGDSGKSSIRAGYGLYYTNIEGANTFNFAAAPYSLFYFSSAPPLFATPFITRASGQNLGQRFPIPPVTSSSNIDWSQFLPFGGNRAPLIDSPTPYAEHVNFSIQRQLESSTLLTLAYVGTFGHHLILNADNNPGDPALCLSVSQPSQVMPGTPTCGPFGEDQNYYPATGGVIQHTRPLWGPNYAGNGYQLDAGNSDFHAFELSLRRTGGRAQFLLAYTFSKAMDNGSGFGDQILINRNPHLFEALSEFDITHNFSFSYTYELPFDKLFGKNNRATRGWRVSGVTSFATGVPVQIAEVDDRSLVGSTGNSPQYGSTDEPNYTPGTILFNTDPRRQYIDSNGVLQNPYFKTSLFSQEPLGGQGTANRRFFHGPGMNNWNFALLKDLKLTEAKRLEFRGEFFNIFNHAQFYGSNSVDGNFNDGPSSFGGVFSAAAPRIGQLAVKLMF